MGQSSITAVIEEGLSTRAEGGADGAARLRNYVGGAWVETTAEVIESRNPATGEVLARVPMSSAADVSLAAEAALAAQADWRLTPPAVRARSLFKLRDLLEAHRDELARLV